LVYLKTALVKFQNKLRTSQGRFRKTEAWCHLVLSSSP